MYKIIRNWALAIIPISLLSTLIPSQASDTNIWLNLEGNPTCSSLGDNQAVLELRDNDPVVGANSISGNLVDANGNVISTIQTVNYVVVEIPDGNKFKYEVSSWSIDIDGTTVTNDNVNPVNYTILKGRGNAGARVYHFGGIGEGAVEDTTEESAPENASLGAVSFCYGLSVGFQPPDTPTSIASLPACEDIDTDGDGVTGDLFTTGIVCPASGEEQLIINMALNRTNFGFDFDDEVGADPFGVRACTCNTSLPACNPDLGPVLKGTQADDLPAEERSCLEYTTADTNGDGIPEGVNTQVPFSIQGVENPDSYICYTIGGTRYCYGHY